MRPLVIDMRAFGPFAGQQVIDFRQLGDKTFFLIHGPTGSGKTTILDAMCFALFGDSSGGERKSEQMRSHHADAATLTEVTFTFALGDTVYRVSRTPDQMRKAKRGGGETKQPQVATLLRVTQDGGVEVESAIESGWVKVSAAVKKLLGFESAQFRQVIMLPQGKFFEFLKSSSQDREKILQTLFATEVYKRIEEHLSKAASEVTQQSAELHTRRQTLLAQAEVADEATLEARLAGQVEAILALNKAEQEAAAKARQAEAQLGRSRQLNALFEEFDKAGEALKAAKSQEQEWAARRSTLARGRDAARVQPFATALADAQTQLEREGKLLAQQVTESEAASKRLDLAKQAMEREQARGPELDQSIAEVNRLAGLEARVAALDKAKMESDSAATRSKTTAEQKVKADRAMTEATESQRKLAQDLHAQQLLAAGLEGHRASLERSQAQLDLTSKLRAAMGDLTAAKTRLASEDRTLASSSQALSQARAQREALQKSWVAGQAARLAGQLVTGQPCPVCGSAEHPSHAAFEGDLVPDEALQTADDSVAKAESTVNAANARQAAAQASQAALAERISEMQVMLGGPVREVEELRKEKDAAAALLKTVESAAVRVKSLEALQGKAAEEFTRCEAAAKAAELLASEASSQQRQCEAVLEERRKEVPVELTDGARLKAAQTEAEGRREAIRKAMESTTKSHQSAKADLDRLDGLRQGGEQHVQHLKVLVQGKADDLQAQLDALHFAAVQALRGAALPEADMTALEAAIQQFDAGLVAAVLRLERAVTAVENQARPDLNADVAQHEAAKALHLSISNQGRDVLAAHTTTQGYAESLRAIAADHQALQERYAIVKKVADVASGSNPQRLSFHRYVLATLLEEVLAATTLRLRVMSRGRYEMRRKLEASDLRSASGLDLEVFDHYTGMTRAVATLSGGESFLASLALALGLSDVVQSYAGGIRLDAIFVDEGFGSLDPEALDFAIRALKDLQLAGRMVGIISHVGELREWIDARLEVRPNQTGSIAEFVV